MIEVEGLSKLYGRSKVAAVDNITFRVNDGEILGFAGLNGAGKTTTINSVSGVLLPSRGRILVDGYDTVKDKPRASKQLGWVSEFPSFEQNVKPIPLMKYFAGFYGMSSSQAQEKSMVILKDVGLDTSINKKLRSFSQGMKKRFGLASAMLSDPKNYLLDEILNGLDPEGVNYVRKQVLEFKKSGKSVLLSTHILGVLENVADRILIIHRGKILQVLTKDTMKTLGKTVLDIKPDHIDNALIQMLAKYGEPARREDHVVLSEMNDPEATAHEISAALIRGGYTFSHFEIVGASLEEYFLKLVEENS